MFIMFIFKVRASYFGGGTLAICLQNKINQEKHQLNISFWMYNSKNDCEGFSFFRISYELGGHFTTLSGVSWTPFGAFYELFTEILSCILYNFMKFLEEHLVILLSITKPTFGGAVYGIFKKWLMFTNKY